MATAFPTVERLRLRWREMLAAPAPALALELAPGRVTAARLGDGSGGGIRGARRELPPGTVTPSAVSTNLANLEDVAAGLRAVLASLGGSGPAVTLLVPDLTARVSVLDFDTLPKKATEQESLARLRLRKSLPFSDEQAALSCQALSATRLLVAVADRARLDEYETCLEAAGAGAALVLPAGLACLGALPVLEHATLLVRALPGSLTTAFCWDGKVEFFRVIELAGPPVMDDIFPSAAFYRDRWETAGAGAAPALIVTAGLDAELIGVMEQELPWAKLRPAEVGTALNATWTGESGGGDELLAVAGAVRGRFS